MVYSNLFPKGRFFVVFLVTHGGALLKMGGFIYEKDSSEFDGGPFLDRN